MSLLKLRLSMIGTITVIIAASTLALTVIMTLMGTLNEDPTFTSGGQRVVAVREQDRGR